MSPDPATFPTEAAEGDPWRSMTPENALAYLVAEDVARRTDEARDEVYGRRLGGIANRKRLVAWRREHGVCAKCGRAIPADESEFKHCPRCRAAFRDWEKRRTRHGLTEAQRLARNERARRSYHKLVHGKAPPPKVVTLDPMVTPVVTPAQRKNSPAILGVLGFELFKSAYPKRSGSQPWARAIEAANARIKEGAKFTAMIEGARRYATFCDEAGNTGTEYVMQAATFLGPEQHFLQPWTPPPSASEAPVTTVAPDPMVTPVSTATQKPTTGGPKRNRAAYMRAYRAAKAKS